MKDKSAQDRKDLQDFLTILEPRDGPKIQFFTPEQMRERVKTGGWDKKWVEEIVRLSEDFSDYRQAFLPSVHIQRAPWYAIWWFNVQKWTGWIWLRRWAGNPHPWDENT